MSWGDSSAGRRRAAIFLLRLLMVGLKGCEGTLLLVGDGTKYARGLRLRSSEPSIRALKVCRVKGGGEEVGLKKGVQGKDRGCACENTGDQRKCKGEGADWVVCARSAA